MRYTARTLVTSAVLLLGICLGNAASGNLIVNGTFDTLVPSNNTGGGWTSLFVNGSGGWYGAGGAPGPFFALNNNGQTFDPTVLQSISGLAIGTTYQVTGDYKLHLFAGGNPANSFEVRLDNAPLLSIGPSAPLGVWASFATSFVATSSTHQISFVAETFGSDHDYGVDNIVVAVPEPANWICAAVALSCLAARRVRVRR